MPSFVFVLVHILYGVMMYPHPSDSIISPSLLSADLSILGSECVRLVDAGADWLHIDVMDGHFVPNLTIGAPVIQAMRRHAPNAFFDCHLMVSNPEKWVEDFAKAGADSYTFHIEATPDAVKLVEKIKAHGMRAAVSIKPNTPVGAIEHIAEKVDMLLVMTVEPGFGGQSFRHEQVGKIAEIRRRWPHLNIEVDGGIAEGDTVEAVAAAGANIVVSGTGVLKAKTSTPAEAIRNMRSVLDKHKHTRIVKHV